MAPKFGTSGLRGLVAELTDTLCARYTLAFLGGTAPSGTVLLGGDLRPSTRQHLRAVAAGARAAGVTPVDCGAVPTPALALEALRQGAPAIMITGSHIPADRNGLKFYTKTGEITKADETAINDRLADWHGPLDLSEPAPIDGVADRYIARFTDFFGPHALQDRRIGVYEHSAVGRDHLGTVLRALGATVTSLGRSDHFIPVDTEAVDDATRCQLRAWAKADDLDAIVSLDGDSDRPLVSDANGRVIVGDVIGALSARYLGARVIVTPVSSNTMIETMDFDRIIRTRIGSPFVIEGIEQALADDAATRVVGYEANGGFLTGTPIDGANRRLSPLMTRDAFLPIICALAGIGDHGPLADQLVALPARRTAADRLVGLPTETSAALVAGLVENPEKRATLFAHLGAETELDLTDGVRVRFASGDIVHLRPSGNAPELRCYAEATTQQRADDIVRTILGDIAARYA
ncbi:phosphomannomutase [Oceaniglobus ichthyenteri]|uniref:phosphomannomutase n=1 Tax=Oceaniglobus ichthyenteri TaxID=2136177 RepID=UPI000D3BA67A|nr:phosphomannomutase [Oceaniglobus ichthyenteri]